MYDMFETLASIEDHIRLTGYLTGDANMPTPSAAVQGRDRSGRGRRPRGSVHLECLV